MSIEPGTYLGGVRTIEDIRSRCFIDEDTGCWHWKLAINGGAPHIHFHLDGKSVVMRGRRAVKVLETGQRLSKSLNCLGLDSCDPDCVAPAHIKVANRKALGAQIRRTGKCKTLKKKASGRDAAKAKRKLTVDQVLEIRSSDFSQRALAQQFGVSQCTIWAARSGKSFREGLANNSVFNWRPSS